MHIYTCSERANRLYAHHSCYSEQRTVQHRSLILAFSCIRTLVHSTALQEPDYYTSSMRHVSPKAKDLLRRMLSKDKTQRCTAREALSHDWFTAVAPLTIEPEPAPVLQVCVHTLYDCCIYVYIYMPNYNLRCI
jgi:serine/threonine protein kinase